MGLNSPEADNRGDAIAGVLSFDRILKLSRELQTRGRREESERQAKEIIDDLVRSDSFRERFAPVLSKVDIQVKVDDNDRWFIRGSEIGWEQFRLLKDESLNLALESRGDYLLHSIPRDIFLDAFRYAGILVYVELGQVEISQRNIESIIRECMLVDLVYGGSYGLNFESAPVLLFGCMKLVEHLEEKCIGRNQ